MKLMAALVAALLVAPAGGPNASQMRPAGEPTTSGPISYDPETYEAESRCRRRKLTFEGETTGVYRYCTFFLRFDPESETDVERDYGAVWIQSRLNPRNGWCAERMKTVIGIGPEAEVHDKAPRGTAITERKRKRARLVVDAEGAALEEAVVRNAFTLYPDRMRVRKASEDERVELRIAWAGATRKSIAFAGGVEISWDVEGLPSLWPGATPRLRRDC
ncbi:MAG: hypothetical protein ACRDKZ_05350 [Actinomycetota bacterium]